MCNEEFIQMVRDFRSKYTISFERIGHSSGIGAGSLSAIMYSKRRQVQQSEVQVFLNFTTLFDDPTLQRIYTITDKTEMVQLMIDIMREHGVSEKLMLKEGIPVNDYRKPSFIAWDSHVRDCEFLLFDCLLNRIKSD